MTPIMQLFIGTLLLGLGSGLVWLGRSRRLLQDDALHLLFPNLDQDPEAEEDEEEFQPAAPSVSAPAPIADTETAEPEGLQRLAVERLKRVYQNENGVTGLPLPINRATGTINLDKWAANIANNIYLRCSSERDGDVRHTIDAAKGGPATKISRENLLIPVAWLQILIHDEMEQKLRLDLAATLEDIAGELTQKLQTCMALCFDPAANIDYQPKLVIYVNNDMGRTDYHLKYYPLPPADTAVIHCEGGLSFRNAGGKSALPSAAELQYQVGDKTLEGKRYAPIMEQYGEIISIGPKPWCHLRTDRDAFDANLVLAWRRPKDNGEAGAVEVMEFEGSGKVFLELPGYQREPLHKPKTRIHLPVSPGPRTTAAIYRRQDGRDTQVGTLTLANPPADVGALPQVYAFAGVDWEMEGPESFCQFLTTRAWLCSRFRRDNDQITHLHQPEGLKLLEQRRFLDQDLPNQDARLTANQDLYYRIQVVVPTGSRRKLKGLFDAVALSDGIRDAIVQLTQTNDFYKALFAPDAFARLKPNDQRPGLAVEIEEDDMIPAGATLVRCMPILTSIRRREIFGELLYDEWDKARDISGMSCNPKRNFLIEYPQGSIMMRISRFPLYGVRAPEVNGVITISLEEPATDGQRLVVENLCQTNINVDGREISPDDEKSFPIPAGQDHRIRLAMGDSHAMQIHIYAKPVEQMREPEFVPAPGKLSLEALTLDRREAITQWRESAFFPLWSQALNSYPDLELLGVKQITRNGYLATLVRESTTEEVHYFTAEPAKVKTDLYPLELAAGENTLLKGQPLGYTATIWEDQRAGELVDYTRADFNGDLSQIANAEILLDDYYERFAEQVDELLPSGVHINEIDLLRRNANASNDPKEHLYTAQNRTNSGHSGVWLFQPNATVHQVRNALGEVMELDTSNPLIGPFDVNLDYVVDWQGGKQTPLAFGAESHRSQAENYLYDGVASLRAGVPFGVNLATGRPSWRPATPVYVSSNPVAVKYNPSAVNPKSQLNFDPKPVYGPFDQDSFRIEYSPKTQSYVVISTLHKKHAVTPKTMFMILPLSGGRPILGSHALESVAIPTGSNLLVFPGLTFKFTQGPVYYGITV